MPDFLSVVSTCIDKAVHCGETKGRLYFLLVFIFKIRKHCYNCADYSCYTSNNCNDSVCNFHNLSKFPQKHFNILQKFPQTC